jgi:hypothetical protein
MPTNLLFSLIVVALLTGGPGCNRAGSAADDDDTAADADSDADSDADTDADSDADTDSDTDTQEEICGGASAGEVHTVPSPPDGVAPNPEDLCAVAGPVAVSNQATHVALVAESWDLEFAPGTVALAADLVGRVVGLPVIEITEALPPELTAEFTDVAPTDDGFSFNVAFGGDVWLYPGEVELAIKVTVEVDCDDSSDETQLVESTTFLHLCAGVDHPSWVASGGECTVCSEVCEKIACPLPASRDEGPAALAGSPRAEIVPVAIHGRSVVLFVEHQGTAGRPSYRWQVSGGEITGAGEAGIIWHVPREPGPHLVQVAVSDDTSATVAVLRWRHRG